MDWRSINELFENLELETDAPHERQAERHRQGEAALEADRKAQERAKEPTDEPSKNEPSK